MTTHAPQRSGQRRRPVTIAAVAVVAVALGVATAPVATAATAHTVLAPGNDFFRISNVFGAPGKDQVRVEYHTPGGKLAVEVLHARAGSVAHQNFGATVQYLSIHSGLLVVGAPNFQPKAKGAAGAQRGALEIYKATPKGFVWQQRILGDAGASHLGAVLATGTNVAPHTSLIAAETRSSNNVIVFRRNTKNTAFVLSGSTRLTAPAVTALSYGNFKGEDTVDIAVGSATASKSAGQVSVFYGGGTPWKKSGSTVLHPADAGLGSAAGTRFGAALAAGIRGEVVLDYAGQPEAVAGGPSLVIGAPGTDGGAGAIVELNSAPTGLDIATKTVVREGDVAATAADGAGYGSAIIVGRVDGEVDPEVVVGAPNAKVSGHTNAGAIFLGKQRTTLATAGVPGDPQHDAYFGRSLAMKKYEFDDYGPLPGAIFVGAPGEDFTATDSGEALFIPSGDGGLGAAKARAVKDVAGARLGTSVDATE